MDALEGGAGFITLRANPRLGEGKVGLWEVDDAHPDNEGDGSHQVFAYVGGPDQVAFVTAAVLTALAERRVMQVGDRMVKATPPSARSLGLPPGAGSGAVDLHERVAGAEAALAEANAKADAAETEAAILRSALAEMEKAQKGAEKDTAKVQAEVEKAQKG